jgi:enoyl-CoA hydratase/carnithine racemase
MKQVRARQARRLAADGGIFQAAYALAIGLFNQVFRFHHNDW